MLLTSQVHSSKKGQQEHSLRQHKLVVGASVAQVAERSSSDRKVIGSNPGPCSLRVEVGEVGKVRYTVGL